MKLLGIDYGTTSVKAALFDENLQQSVCLSEDYTLKIKDDIVEFEAVKYWDILEKLLGTVLKESKVDALSIDTQCETLILTDEFGNPVRDAIVWLDNRATKEAEIIEEHFGRQKVYEITGQPEITATWPACKLLWIKNNEPEVWAKTKKIFLLEDYLLYKLTGEFVTEKTLQSSSLYFDINEGKWWREEEPTPSEMAEGAKKLDERQCRVDYIITHEPPSLVKSAMLLRSGNPERINKLNGYFEEIGKNCEFSHWYFGSLHEDRVVTPLHTCVFKKMIPLTNKAK